MTIDEAVEYAACKLPPSCWIDLTIENGGYSVTLVSNGARIDIDSADTTIADQIIEAVEIANK